MDLKNLIRTVPHYPKNGIMFRDITTLLADAKGFQTCIAQLAAPYKQSNIEVVAAIEARGFIIGGAIADHLETGFVPLRKKGKLPAKAIGQEYALEYGMDIIEMHEDAVRAGQRVLVVDDLIATGGTAEAGIKLLRQCGAHVIGACFIIDLPDLGGRQKIEAMDVPCHYLMSFDGH